jgi:formylglycine-generating enzyme required for sulfatase activity
MSVSCVENQTAAGAEMWLLVLKALKQGARDTIVHGEATKDQNGLHNSSIKAAGDEANFILHMTQRSKRFLKGCVVGFLLASAFAIWHAGSSCGGPPDPGMQPYTETIPGTKVSFTMVPIPAGEFDMGSSRREPGHRPDEAPVHRVAVRAFWMGRTEVTWDEYDQYWQKEPEAARQANKVKIGDSDVDATTRPTPPYADETFGHGREGHPVLGITHHAAMEFCHWLSQKTRKTYRLPTEAEWEYACRAGTKTAYFFGDDPSKLSEYAWYAANSEDLTHTVGQKKPNPWGLYDMYGNVAEWCLDSYRADYYQTLSGTETTLAPVLLPKGNRFGDVVRGGSWADDALRCRSAARRPSQPRWIRRDPQRPQSIWWLTDADFVGFRIVRPLAEQENLKDLRSLVTRDSSN